MKLASLIIQDINNNVYNDKLTDVYVDASLVDAQKARYVKAIEKFMELYGDREVEIYSTPGRSEVSGNHTDHQHGCVLAAAINLDIIAVVAKDDEKVKVLSDNYDLKAVNINELAKVDAELINVKTC